MPGGAQAHAMFGSAAPFWSGVLHVLVAPLALAAVAALVLALAEAGESAILRAVAAAAIAAFGTAELVAVAPACGTASAAIAPVCVVAIAVMAALRQRPSLLLACVLGAGSGIATGAAIGADVPDWGGSLGVAVALLVLVSWGAAGLAHLQERFAQSVSRMRRWSAALIAALAVALAVISARACG